jgi:hypothetical protein
MVAVSRVSGAPRFGDADMPLADERTFLERRLAQEQAAAANAMAPSARVIHLDLAESYRQRLARSSPPPPADAQASAATASMKRARLIGLDT